MSPRTEQGASLNPEDFSRGGILNDEDIEVMEARFFTGEDAAEITEDLAKGKDYEEGLFLGALLKVLNGDLKGEELWQWWSSGKLIYFVPSKDGSRAVPAPGSTSEKLSDGSNAYTLFASMVNAGYPRDKFTDDVTALMEGMLAHVIRVDQQKRSGLDSSEGGRLRTVLTVESIHEDSPVGVPGKKRRGKATGKAKKAAEESENGDDFDEIAATTIVQILVDADGGPVKRTSVVGRMLKILKKSHPDDFKAIIQATNEEDFFEDHNDWVYDGKNLEIGEGED